MAKAEEDFNMLKGLAERLKLDESEQERFIGESMKRFGHKMRSIWEDGAPEQSDGSGFFGSGGSQREKRDVSGGGKDPFYT